MPALVRESHARLLGFVAQWIRALLGGLTASAAAAHPCVAWQWHSVLSMGEGPDSLVHQHLALPG